MKKIYAILFTLLSASQLLSNNITWSFPPVAISTVNQNASAPQVAIDANGDVIAAWVENGVVKSKSKPINMNWSTEATVSNTGASSPCLVSDPNGHATAVWLESGVVKAASKTLSGSWSTEVVLSGSSASSPTLAVDVNGDVVAMWARAGNIESSTKLFGGNWQNHVTLASTGAASPRLAIGGSGANLRVVAVWQGTSGTTNVVYSSNKLISGSWSTQQILSDTNHNAVNATAAVDINGNATAVWYAYDLTGTVYSNVIVQSASRPSSGSWSIPVSLSTPGIRNPTALVARVAYDSTGNAIAIWNTSFDDETFSIESSVKPVIGNWTPATDLVSLNLFAFAEDIEVTSFGDVLSLYMFYNGASLLIQSTESDIDGFTNNIWGVPITVSTGSQNGYPRLAASLSGNVINAVAVWISSNGVNNNIAASTGSKTLVLPPSGLTVTQHTQNYGVFIDYYNTLSWVASTDPNLAGYVIFRNGLPIATVDASVLQIQDNNRTQNGAVTYGVVAIDNQQSQSRIVTVNFP